MKSRSFLLGAIAVLVATFAMPVAASEEPLMGEYDTHDRAPAEPKVFYGSTPMDTYGYGTTDWIVQSMSYSAFVPLSDAQWASGFTYAYRIDGSNSGACADVFLPGGALLTGLTRYIYDDSATGRMEVSFDRLDMLNGTYDNLYNFETDAVGTPGWQRVYADLTLGDHTVDNYLASYRVCVFQWTTTGGTLGHRGVTFWYKRQVSPAPASATFNDVGTGHPFFRFVEALYESGITAGCGGGNYCPDSPITRGEMAVFLAAALGLHFPY
jgi:hypothetical protein